MSTSGGNGATRGVAATDIAIVGMACRVPGAQDVDAFWRNVRDGVESVRRYSVEELRAAGVPSALLANPRYVPAGAPLEHMEAFDAAFFGMSAHEASIMDPQHRQVLECAWEVLEHAGHPASRFRGPIGIFAGSGHNAYLPFNLLSRPELVESEGLFLLRHTGNDKDFLTTRVSYAFNLRGPSVAVQTACSTSLVAVHLGVQSLLAGECDLALAGGVTIELPHRQGYLYAEGEILSPDGHCRPFDAHAAGTVFGSGVGMVALRRLADAIADGDTIYAVVKGTAVNNDGSDKVSYLAPSIPGQASAVAEALAVSGVDPRTIGYLEAHGTGTPVGDPIEVAALTEAYRQYTDARGFCGIGSVKSNIGHLDTAAGVMSLIKAVQALRHRELPPSLNFSSPNAACRFDETPFFVNAELNPWPSDGPRRAGVNSLGVGGTNAHVILEEYLAPATAPAAVPGPEVLVLSAQTPEALDRATERLVEALGAPGAPAFADSAWTLQVGREPMPHRRIVAATTAADAADRLTVRDPRQVFTGEAPEQPRSVAFMFAGGGTQYPRMGQDLYQHEATYRDAMDECLALLEPAHAGQVRSALFPVAGAEAEAARLLEQPSLGLPALFITQVALARCWQAWGIVPTALIGHSMGEYTAACLAGVFSLQDALALVTMRGRLFEGVKPGAMLSVPLAAAELEPLLGPDLSIAAINAPELAVASGTLPAIERLEQLLAARGFETSRLRINVAAHSALLAPILTDFHAFVRRLELQAPRIPVASNLTGTWLTEAEATDPEYWVRHLRQTVRFSEGIQALTGDRTSVLMEVGPGRTLAALARLQAGAASPTLSSMPAHDEGGHDATFLRTALGRLWLLGVPVDWERVQHGQRRRVALPTYPFARTRHWVEPGTSAPAPLVHGRPVLERQHDVAQWFSQPSWRRLPPHAQQVPRGPVLVLAERDAFARQLVDQLRAAGADIVVARPGKRFTESGPDGYTVSPDRSEDLARLLASLRDRGRSPRHIVVAWGRRRRQGPQAFQHLLALAQAVGSEELGEVTMVLVAAGAARVAGEDTIDPWQAALGGAMRVIPSELPGVEARVVDLPVGRPASAQVERLVIEILCGGPALVALRGPDRWSPSFEPLPLTAPATPAFREEGTYLITGGLGGIGLAVARYLATHYRARLVLMGRTANATDGAAAAARLEAVRDLSSTGARVLVLQADVTNQRQLREVVKRAQAEFGALHGVFHAAGVLDDGALQVRTAGAASKVLAPKVEGTRALAQALDGVPADFVVLFSSISAFAGLPGQFDYAAANAFMDGWAQAQAARAAGGDRAVPRFISVNWAPWSDTGMAAEMAESLGMASPFQGEPTPHPLLTRRVHLSAREYALTGRLDAGTDWILAEHRVRGGQPMVPGTGFLALAGVAEALGSGREAQDGERAHAGWGFREVEFVEALIVPEGERVEVRVRRNDLEGRWQVESRSGAGTPWRVHARGRMGAAAGSPAPIDLEVLRYRCTGEEDPSRVSTAAPHLAFGPRWDNVRRIRLAQREAMLELELAPRFAPDLTLFPLHPALMDMALVGAQALVPWLDRASQFLVPLSLGALRVYDALPRQVVSRVRFREDLSTPGDVAVFDATVCDADGRVLVEAQELSLLAVRDRGRLATAPATPVRHREAALANPLLALTLREGIRAVEGMDALERIVAAGAPAQVTVSPLPLAPLLAEFRSLVTAAPPSRDLAPGKAAEPMTAMEREVAGIASGLLGTAPLSLDDNLIDLGLHSLLAVRLFTRLKKATGTNLPLATLLEAPTVRTLAGRFAAMGARSAPGEPGSEGGTDLMAASDQARDPRAHAHWLRPLWSHVVPLKPTGTLPPFFSIHARGGAVLNYRTLATFVDPDQPLYGIQCRGLDGRTEPFRSIEEMADQYLGEIRRIQPQGPYFLGGGSLGGVVALEIGERLRREGEVVGLIAMFDSWGPVWFSPSQQPGERSRLWRKLNAQVERLRRQGALSSTRLIWMGLKRRVVVPARLMAARVLRALGLEVPHNLRYFYVEYANLAALQRFTPNKYDGDIVLFRALDDPDADFSDPTMGWRGSVLGQIEVIDAPGTHNSIVHDAVFGELFRQRLRRAQEEALAARQPA